MTDPFKSIEQELSLMRPRLLPAEVIERIEQQLGIVHSNDRWLVGSISLGAFAACVITCLLYLEPRVTISSPLFVNVAAHPSKPGDIPQVFVWADHRFRLTHSLENP